MTNETPMSSADKILARLRLPQHEIDEQVERAESNLAKVDRLNARIAELKSARFSDKESERRAHHEHWTRVRAENEEEARRNEARSSEWKQSQGVVEARARYKALEEKGDPIPSSEKLCLQAIDRAARKSKIVGRLESDQI